MSEEILQIFKQITKIPHCSGNTHKLKNFIIEWIKSSGFKYKTDKAGNIFSIKKALQKAGAEIVIIEDNTEIKKVDKLILPGVGNFANAIEELQSKNLLNDLINFKGFYT